MMRKVAYDGLKTKKQEILIIDKASRAMVCCSWAVMTLI